MKAYLRLGSLSGMIDMTQINRTIYLSVPEGLDSVQFLNVENKLDSIHLKRMEFEFVKRLNEEIYEYHFTRIV